MKKMEKLSYHVDFGPYYVHLTRKQKRYLAARSVIDRILAALALVLLSPLFLAVSIAQKVSAPDEPIFFLQKRVGKGAHCFNIIKFRTMKSSAPKNVATGDLENPQMYISKVGRFLRDTSISAGAERQRHYRAVVALRKDPCEENLWKCVVAFRGYKFKTMSGLPFTYTLKKGRGDEFTKELWIDRREGSKSLAWSSVLLAYHNISKIGEVVDRPRALGDIRGVSYIYGLFYRFGLIDVPDKVKEKMGVKEH